VKLAPAATPAPQVLLATANGPLTPLTATLLTVSVVFRRFVSVIMRVEFVASTTLPKLKLVGENVTGALPLPESVTVCVPALSVIVTLPEAAPTTVGANDTWMVHDAAGTIGPLQLLVWLNGAVATTFETCSGPVPLLALFSEAGNASARLRSSISVFAPYHLKMSPRLSRTGSIRNRKQRYSPSYRRRGASISPAPRSQ
jgi:hypothetical protein